MFTLVGVALSNIDNIAIAIVAISAALALIFKGLFKIHNALNLVDYIYHEVVPNAGSSLRDAIDRIEKRVAEIDSQHQIDVAKIKEDLDKFNKDNT